MSIEQRAKESGSVGVAVHEYVKRKFGENESGQLILSHEALRYIIANFTIEWLNAKTAMIERAEKELKEA